MRAKVPYPVLWVLWFGFSVWGDYHLSRIIPAPVLLLAPVIVASRISGRNWGMLLALTLPMAHAFTLYSLHLLPFDIKHLIPGMILHMLTLSMLAEMIHRLVDQKRSERDRLVKALDEAMSNIKILKGMLPICAGCKSIRDDKGYWKRIEEYLAKHSELEFSHGMCPDCIVAYFPDFATAYLEKSRPEKTAVDKPKVGPTAGKAEMAMDDSGILRA